MKFWIGVGVLRHKGDSYSQDILSSAQREKVKFTSEDININGLEGKNFGRIRIVN